MVNVAVNGPLKVDFSGTITVAINGCPMGKYPKLAVGIVMEIKSRAA